MRLTGRPATVGGMAKGSGMIHPNMATTLNFVTTDVCDFTAEMIQKALSEIVKVTYNCLSVDGDTSTNDMVMRSGKRTWQEIRHDHSRGRRIMSTFHEALYQVLMTYDQECLQQGRRGRKRSFWNVPVAGAPDLDTAIIVAKSVIRSPLFKCAMFGEDANWGRVLCAIGYADAEFADRQSGCGSGIVKQVCHCGLQKRFRYSDFSEENCQGSAACGRRNPDINGRPA